MGIPNMKIRGKPENVIIGNDVIIGGDIDIRNRENGKIIISDNVVIDHNCRFVAANNATITIGLHSKIGSNNTYNCGASLTIGEKCVTAGMVYINTSDHMFLKSACILDQGYTHAPVVLEDDVWIGGNVVINKGITLGKGAIVGANAVVTKDLPAYSINIGIPAKTIRYRE